MPRHADQPDDRAEEQGRSWFGRPNPRRQGRMSDQTRYAQSQGYERYGMDNEDWRHMDDYWRTMYGAVYPHEKEWNRGGRVGTYAGRESRNYKWSDERIREDVQKQLTRYPTIDATDINVSVRDGVVALRGTVDRREMKQTAEEVAKSVSGVRDFRNEIKVQKMKRHQGKRAA